MNIILNSYCNLKCNYCFADEYMEETVKSPEKTMDFDFFAKELLPKVSKAPVINFMGGEPTLHPRFVEMMKLTYEAITPGASLGLFTNGLMSEKALDLLVSIAGPNGARLRKIYFAVLLNWQTRENISEKNHQRCQEIAETLLRVNGFSVTFSINLYSKNQDLSAQCREIDAIYQNAGLPRDQMYRIRVSPAFPIVGGESNAYLPIRDYPAAGRVMFAMLKKYPQMCFRFDCSFPPCFLDDIQEDEMHLAERFYYHGFKQTPAMETWGQQDLYFGCADGSPMDIDGKGDCFNCFPFHNLKLGNIGDFKEVNSIATARMGSKFLNTVFEETKVKEPCRSCPHYMVRCSSGCFAYNFV
ncbi:MAG: radical SAM protein [Candidatus Nitrohelix vancouverensis]|uniref:Radical SAM protein n=2 Tax=root TaxID=1 RepID=A0A7T0G2S1_9BACT|nr:MAG: radical SAM protein [Candidatus Nitrohelix vancouverensis]